MDYKIKGKVIAVGEVKEVGSNGFRKREVVVDTSRNESYPCPVQVTFKKDDCEKADALGVGDIVAVEGWIEGRKWTSPKGDVRYFTDLTAKSLIVEKSAAVEDPAAVGNWAQLQAFANGRGMKKEELVKIGTAYTQAHKTTFNALTTADWVALAGAVVDAIRAEEAAAGKAAAPQQATLADAAGVADDMPF